MNKFLRECRRVRWLLVVPIAILLFASAFYGLEEGRRAEAFIAFTQRRYDVALEKFWEINDRSGAGMTYLALNRVEDASFCFTEAADTRGLGLCDLKKRIASAACAKFTSVNDEHGLGLAHLALRDEQKAREAFVRVNDWQGLGLVALAKNDFRDAERCFGVAGDRSGLALVALAENRLADAERFFTEANDTSGRGLVALARRDYATARRLFAAANDLSGLGAVSAATENFTAAEHFFKQVNDWNGLGDLYSRAHMFAAARRMFEQDSNPVKVIQSWRNDYTLPNRFEAALAYGRAAVDSGNRPAECLMEMADILYEMKRYDEALAALERAKEDPDRVNEARMRKGRLHFFLRDLARARAEFEQVRTGSMEGGAVTRDAQEALATLAKYEAKGVAAKLRPAAEF